MSLRYPRSTLAHYLSRPVALHRDVSSLPLKVFTQRTKEYMSQPGFSLASPDHEAVTFYCLNHIVAAIRQAYTPHEPLPQTVIDLLEQADAIVSDQALRAMHYLLLICTREARHCHSKPKMLTQFPNSPSAKFLQSGASETGIGNELLQKTPNTTIGDYVTVLSWQFYKCSYAGGYGGPKWGNVTDCLVRFCKGEFTAEMMLDTNWTLAHNGGPIFNKGQLYGSYSHDLYRILDVQRAGMIPTAVMHDKQISAKATPLVKKLLGQAQSVLDGLVMPGVDWVLVKKLGAKHNYEAEIKQQLGQGIPTSDAPGLTQPGKIGKYGKKPTEPAYDPSEYYQIMPGAAVKKIKRAA